MQSYCQNLVVLNVDVSVSYIKSVEKIGTNGKMIREQMDTLSLPKMSVPTQSTYRPIVWE
jgi:hypothetical protein